MLGWRETAKNRGETVSTIRRYVPRWSLALAALVSLAGCTSDSVVEPPQRATDAVEVPQVPSQLSVPVEADIGLLTRAIEAALPRRLWSIDKRGERCVPPQRVRVFGESVPVTPVIRCDIVGEVRRGAVRLRGEGRDIIVELPLNATVRAERVAGTALRESATGSAMAEAHIRLDMTEQWQPRATVRLNYRWRQPPTVEFLGQRIAFAEDVDAKLAPVVRDLERALPRELAKLDLRPKVERVWRQAFTSLSLNRDNPPVWMRLTPQRLAFGGYRITGRTLTLDIGMEAVTETFVGPRPEPKPPTPLPPMARMGRAEGLGLFVPVIADYAELEPVIAEALQKRAQRPFVLPGIGPVMAEFGRVTAYGTGEGRVAVGLALSVQRQGANGAPTQGTVWMTARPVNEPGSLTVGFADLVLVGSTNKASRNLLLQLAQYPPVAEEIAAALTQNFTRDFIELRGKIDRAIVNERQGDFLIRARLDRIETGQLRAAGQGLYLPLRAQGTAEVLFRPGR